MVNYDIPTETRGRKPKYRFDPNLKVGEQQRFTGDRNIISICARRWIRVEELGWLIRCFTKGDEVVILRTK